MKWNVQAIRVNEKNYKIFYKAQTIIANLNYPLPTVKNEVDDDDQTFICALRLSSQITDYKDVKLERVKTMIKEGPIDDELNIWN